jgi:hypothetical protein
MRKNPGPIATAQRLGVLCLATAWLVSCSFFESSPSRVARAAYSAANAGRYSEAESYFHQPLPAESAARLHDMLDMQTLSGGVDRIDVVREQVDGNEARVELALHYKNGGAIQTLPVYVDLVREQGHWKIEWR